MLGGEEATVVAQFEGCWDGWAIVLDTLCRVPPIAFDNTEEQITVLGRWEIMYAAPDGTTATYLPQTYTGAIDACITWEHPGNIATSDLSHLVTMQRPKLYDFDGDGHAELFSREAHRVLQDHPEEGGLSLTEAGGAVLLTFRDGKITPYPPAYDVSAFGITDMRDVDGDQRPDLFSLLYGMSTGPWRIAHTLADGTFSKTDAVAVRAMRDQCPSPSTILLTVSATGAVDEDATKAAVACAMIRGENGRDVLSRLRTECTARKASCDVLSWASNMTTFGMR